MGRHIQDKKTGQFKGSVGRGATPTPQPKPYPTVASRHVGERITLTDIALVRARVERARAIVKQRYQLEPRRRDNVRHKRMRDRRKQPADQESQEPLSAPTSRPATNKPTSRQVA